MKKEYSWQVYAVLSCPSAYTLVSWFWLSPFWLEIVGCCVGICVALWSEFVLLDLGVKLERIRGNEARPLQDRRQVENGGNSVHRPRLMAGRYQNKMKLSDLKSRRDSILKLKKNTTRNTWMKYATGAFEPAIHPSYISNDGSCLSEARASARCQTQASYNLELPLII